MTEPEDQARSEPPELREYFRVLWVRKWTLLLVVALVIGAMLFLSVRQTPLYESEAKVLVPPPAQSVGSTGGIEFGKSEPEVEAEVATSEPVGQAVIDSLKLQTTPQDLLDRVDVTPLKNTSSVLMFGARSPSPEQAQAIAHEFAVQYLQYRRDQYAAGFRTELASVNSQLQSVTKRLASAKPEERFTLADEKATLAQRRSQIVTAIEQTKTTGGDILTDAGLPKNPFQPDHVRAGIVGLIVGILLGIGAAFLKDYVDDRLRGTEDVERQVAAPVLGSIPRFAGSERKRKRKRERDGPADPQQLVVLGESKSAPVEAYRTLRTNLMFMAASGPLHRVLITSPRQAEGKSTTAANLAVVFAQAGHRVLLIDADLRRPAVHRIFGLENQIGLSSVLSAQASLEDAVQNPGVTGLRIVTSGPVPPNPVELLSSPAMRQLIEQVADVTDWLIMDAPPVLGLADASALSSMTDGVLLVVSQSTSRRELGHARDQLNKVGATVVGTVLNGFASDTGGYYTRYYGHPDEDAQAGESKRKRRKREKEEAEYAAADERLPADPGASQPAPADQADALPPHAGTDQPDSAAEPVQAAETEGPPPDEFFLTK